MLERPGRIWRFLSLEMKERDLDSVDMVSGPWVVGRASSCARRSVRVSSGSIACKLARPKEIDVRRTGLMQGQILPVSQQFTRREQPSSTVYPNVQSKSIVYHRHKFFRSINRNAQYRHFF